jgi:hypothetical protein
MSWPSTWHALSSILPYAGALTTNIRPPTEARESP